VSDSLGLGGGSGDSGAVDDIDNVDDGDFNADLNTDDDVGNGSFAYWNDVSCIIIWSGRECTNLPGC